MLRDDSGCVAIGWVSQAKHVKDDDPDSMRFSGHKDWGMGMRLTTSHRKKICCGTNHKPRKVYSASKMIGSPRERSNGEENVGKKIGGEL